jgi:hypothetical protein
VRDEPWRARDFAPLSGAATKTEILTHPWWGEEQQPLPLTGALSPSPSKFECFWKKVRRFEGYKVKKLESWKVRRLKGLADMGSVGLRFSTKWIYKRESEFGWS